MSHRCISINTTSEQQRAAQHHVTSWLVSVFIYIRRAADKKFMSFCNIQAFYQLFVT